MNPSLFYRFKLIFLIGCVFLDGSSGSLQAGVLLTKSKDAQIGNFTETAEGLSLQNEFGNISFKKEDIAWYSLDRSIDTIFKAAQAAYSQGDATSALALYEISLTKEPATQAQAKSQMEDIRAKLTQSVAETLPTLPAVDVDILTPEEKIARGNQMVENGNRFLQITATDLKIIAANKATGEQLIKDGNALIARGEQELAERKAQEEADAARRRELSKILEEANRSVQGMSDFRKIPADDQRHLLITAGIVILITLLSLWQITMREIDPS